MVIPVRSQPQKILIEARQMFISDPEMAKYLRISQKSLKKLFVQGGKFFNGYPKKGIFVLLKLSHLTAKTVWEIYEEDPGWLEVLNHSNENREITFTEIIDTEKEHALPADQYHKYDQKEFQRQIDQALYTLTPREEKILRKLFGLGEFDEHTYEQVGEDFEVTRERVRQIETKGLIKLRHPSRSRRLEVFLEKGIQKYGLSRRKVKQKPPDEMGPPTAYLFPLMAVPAKSKEDCGFICKNASWPTLTTVSPPRGHLLKWVLAPFSENLGALIQIPMSSADKYKSLEDFLQYSQETALRQRYINGHSITPRELEERLRQSREPQFSTHLIAERINRSREIPTEPFLEMLTQSFPAWLKTEGFANENSRGNLVSFRRTVIHRVRAIELRTEYFRFLYVQNIFNNFSGGCGRLYISADWHLPDYQKRLMSKNDVGIEKIYEQFLAYARTLGGRNLFHWKEILNNTQWFLFFKTAIEVSNCVDFLETNYSLLRNQLIGLINETRSINNHDGTRLLNPVDLIFLRDMSFFNLPNYF